MKRLHTALYFLVAFLFVAATAATADGPARVLLGGREFFASPPAVETGGEVYVSPSILESLGAAYSLTDSGDTVRITGANGHTTEITGSKIRGSLMLPLRNVAEALDAEAAWDEQSRAVRLTAKITSVEFVDGELRINSTLPVASTLSEWKDAGKVIVDVHGAKVSTEAREVYVGSQDVQRVRLGEPSEGVARVVVDLNRRVGFRRTSSPIAAQIVVKLGADVKTDETQFKEPPQPTGALTGIAVEPVNDTKLLVKLSTVGKVASQTSLQREPLSLNVELINTTLQMSGEDISVDHPLVKAIHIEDYPDGFRVRVILNTTRFVAYDVNNSDGLITVCIRLPKGAGGKLSEKTIVIDPGHGGRQTGTRNGGYTEKNINLQIAKRVQRLLQEEGANAVLTRDGDHGLSSDLLDDLQARPHLADKLNANLFVSIHCNSGSRGVCGTETYYHMGQSSCRALAQAIQASVIRTTGMKDRRARSDGMIYPGKGFAVLRYAKVPAVLIETGYLSHSGDRACLTSAEFQEKLAKGVVNGIKAYIEGAQ